VNPKNANHLSAGDRLGELLLRWEELHKDGRDISPEELCRDCPQLLGPLRQRIEALRAVDVVLNSPDAATGSHAGTTGGSFDPDIPDPAPRTQQPQPSDPVKQVAGYEVLDELGRGGMGVVYKARQKGLGRLVALKMILDGAYARASDLARFRSEVEAIARLQHPNLIQVYEVGEHDGQPYFSMEFVDGGTLEEKINGQPQPPRQAAELIQTLARALDAVHKKGIVHRDLKPANILLTSDGVPKVTDFGLAKQLDAAAGPTLTKHILGTPSYMAPEQARGDSRHVGPATDVYALGTVLYELLTGRPPFRAAREWDTIVQVAREDPVSPRRLQPTIPLDLETICLKCLQKDPARRYPSAEALAADLGHFLAGKPILARPIGRLERFVKWARRRPTAAALLGVSCLALLALIVLGLIYNTQLRRALTKAEDNAEESRQRLVRLHVAQGAHSLEEGDWFDALLWFTEALRLDQGDPAREEMHRLRIAAVLRQCPRLLQVWSHEGPVRDADFSPDGRHVLTASEDRTARMWDAATGQPRGAILKHDDAVLCGAFSPDGLRVVTASKDGTARLWDAATGQPLTAPLRHAGPVVCASFSRDGKSALTASEDGTARLWEAATGKPLAQPIKHAAALHFAGFSLDGRKVVTASEDGTARVWDALTGAPLTEPLKHDGPVLHAAFHPDGSRVVTASAEGTGRMWDAVSGKPLSVPLKHRGAVVWVAFSPDGKRLVTASDDLSACVWDVQTARLLAPPLKHGGGLTGAVFSPDSRCVVTASNDNTARVWNAASGEPLTPLLKHNGAVHRAVFGPRGRRVLTASNDNTVRLWDVEPAKGRLVDVPQSLPRPRGPSPPVRWLSADRRWEVTAEGNHSAQVRDAATGKPVGRPLRHGSTVLDAAFSPDNSRVVTASDDNTALIWKTASGELLAPPLKHRGTVRCAVFDPSGRLVATAGDDQTVRVWDAATGAPVTPPLRFSGVVKGVFFSPDGGRVGVTVIGQADQAWELRRDDRPVSELIRLAEMLAGSRFDPVHGPLPLLRGK
jgi:WD40 repeat protein/tRNA A-37 threonylcarbamoyl transferase component Bud32